MKKLSLVFCLLAISFLNMALCQSSFIGFQSGSSSIRGDNTPKPTYRYVLVYREWSQYFEQNGDALTPKMRWESKAVFFNSTKEIVDWLNIEHWDKRKGVRIDDNQLIGIYDLTTAKTITVKYKAEKKVIQKHIEVNKQEWTDESYSIEK